MFDNIINFFKKFSKETRKESKDMAKERLHLVLMQDRANVSADFLEMMKQEIIEVIKKYIDVDENSIDGDDVGLLDDLKSDTMVGDAASIKKIIEEEKEFTKELDTMKLDNSFYTSSFSFTKRDFEELKDINHKIKKGNKFIIALLILIIILIIVGSVYYIIK